jgi:hypothetical protein
VFDGVAVTPIFDENTPLRNRIPLMVQLADGTTRAIQSPVTNSVTGAMSIQEFLERYEWVSQAGSPVAYAPHLRKALLQDMRAKTVLYVIFKGDQTAPNPSTTAILRAGELADRTMYYRHDLACVDFPTLQRNPHGFNIASIAPEYLQVDATFFATDGAVVINRALLEFDPRPATGDHNFIR